MPDNDTLLPIVDQIDSATLDFGGNPSNSTIVVLYRDKDGNPHELRMAYLAGMYLVKILQAAHSELVDPSPDDLVRSS